MRFFEKTSKSEKALMTLIKKKNKTQKSNIRSAEALLITNKRFLGTTLSQQILTFYQNEKMLEKCKLTKLMKEEIK